LEFGFNLEDFL